ncbi:MAG: 50S ribosomal protein L30 [Candidatus Diapherotrites archaeon]|uniref:Large ribosomal subunit protein uL30 n=1 Tax=Candidatus Iainarchaeum sp. TaxID=3101447 RepID=A0A2D6M0M8_9ARCH|nr:50S ribosomal protein L30 [Candidatus Diapherotrites archaeon]|tara:strand:+ start:7202 stop:7657 length:456 start_codon:yes stop_codon:yes gene_type:complete
MFAAIRLRGEVDLNPKIKRTLELLRLYKVNHLVLVKESEKKMLEKAQGFLTWGDINEVTLALMLKKRARLTGNKRVDESFLKENKIGSFEELAKSLLDGKTTLEKAGLKPIIRLSPPKKGHKRAGIKKPHHLGGALGYRSDDINALIKKMT